MSFGKHIGRRKATLAEIRSLAETITAGEPHDFSIEVTANGMTCKFTSLDELERYVERYPVVAFPTTFKLTINKYDNGMDRYASVELKEDDTWVYIDSREQEWTLGSALAITNSLKRDRLGYLLSNLGMIILPLAPVAAVLLTALIMTVPLIITLSAIIGVASLIGCAIVGKKYRKGIFRQIDLRSTANG